MSSRAGIPDGTSFRGTATTQLIGWGTLHTPFPPIVAPIEAETGWSRVMLNAASMAGLLASGIAAVLPRTGAPLLPALAWEGGAGYGPVPWLPMAVALVAAAAGRGRGAPPSIPTASSGQSSATKTALPYQMPRSRRRADRFARPPA